MTRRAIYYGRVQGVGFRRRAVRIAEGFAVSGYVCNRSDGTVELEAEGEPQVVEAFLAAVAAAMAAEIQQVTYSTQPAHGYQGFVIIRSE